MYQTEQEFLLHDNAPARLDSGRHFMFLILKATLKGERFEDVDTIQKNSNSQEYYARVCIWNNKQ